MSRTARPPRLARALVRRLTGSEQAEFIVGDLDEEWTEVRERRGSLPARLRYWRLALASVWAVWRSSAGPSVGHGEAPRGCRDSRGSRGLRGFQHRPGPCARAGGDLGHGGPGRSAALHGERQDPLHRRVPTAADRHTGLLDSLAGDLRFGTRMLRRRPGFAAVAIATLALSIGTNTAVFSVMNGVLLRPLPYEDPGELVNVWQVFYEWQDSDTPVFRNMAERFPASYPVYRAWVERGHVFDGIAVYGGMSTILQGEDSAEWQLGAATGGPLFEVLGVEPALGRGFTAAEDRIGGDRVIVLSHGLWVRRFGADPAIIGRVLDLSGTPHTVVGVMPEGFYFPGRDEQFWVPLFDADRNDRWTSQSLWTIARLRNGISLEQARREMDAVTRGILEDNPDSPEVGIRLVGRVEEVAGSSRETLILLVLAGGLVLVVTAANVVALLVVRTSERRHELAVRLALGAGRGRMTVQMLAESVLLTAIGALLGLAVTTWGMDWLRAKLPPTIPRIEDIAIDWRVLAFTVAAATAIAVFFALAAALTARRSDPVNVLRRSGRGATAARQRGRAVLLVGEIAVAVILLVAATLLLGSYLRLTAVDRGFDEEGLLTLTLTAPFDLWSDPVQQRAFWDATFDGIRALPAVESMATVSSLPFGGGASTGSFGLVADPQTDGEEGWSLEEDVSAGYFETMGIPLLQGRTFEPADVGGARRLLVINERLARYYWPEEDPLGQTVWDDGEPHTIVGVVGNVKHASLAEQIERKRYRLAAQIPGGVDGDDLLRRSPWTSLVVRTSIDPVELVPAIQSAVRSLAPMAPINAVAPMAELVGRTTALARFRTTLLTGLAALAVVLAILGLYGVVARSVAGRRREIGIRMSLGAGQGDVLQQVLVSGMALIVPGVVVGLAAALAAVRFVESYLYEVSATDPVTFLAIGLAVLVTGALATWLPARQATRIEPLIVLRGD